MKGKVLKPHPNRSCDLMQLPCQNLSSGKLVDCLGGQRVLEQRWDRWHSSPQSNSRGGAGTLEPPWHSGQPGMGKG